MHAAALPTSGARRALGRYELRQALGAGTQSAVWLARDTQLGRDVALKLLPPGAVADEQWLREARSIVRLAHPHIVPLYDADVHQGQRFLVFEHVDGSTLTQHLRTHGALPAREAVAMMLGMLDALHAAHRAGIVHGDLKPCSVLLDAQGHARVMDFGTAAPVQVAPDRLVCGTPGYVSPEAVRGKPPTPAMDVFAAGMIFALMLTGQPLVREADPLRALERTLHEDFELPAEAAVDDRLRTLVRRALAREPAQRLPSAQAFYLELSGWLQPERGEAGEGGATLEFLLRRMRHKSDFPALSESVARIQRLTQSDQENLGSLTDEILRDVALTHKLLRLVNSAYVGTVGPVTTVSRAVSLIGMSAVGSMAISLILLDRMQDRAHAAQLKEQFLRALLAGTLARELSAGARDGEKAYLAALFQNLGRLLTEFYFPEEAQQIRALLQPAPKGAAAPPDADDAALRVLGIRFDDLGQGVARHWGLPESLQRAMRRARDDATAGVAGDPAEQLRRIGGISNAVADALLEPGEAKARIAEIAQRRGRPLGVSAPALIEATEQAQRRLAAVATAVQLLPATHSPAARLLDSLAVPGGGEASAPGSAAAALGVAGLVEAPPATARDELLAAGIQDISSQMVAEPFQLNLVLRMVLETMLRGLGFRRVVFCLRDPRSEQLTGRFGLGDGATRFSTAFRVPARAAPGATPDLFAAICTKGADTWIADVAAAPAVAAALPGWYQREGGAGAFLLLPLQLKGATFALLYADCARAGEVVMDDQALRHLRTLRNQAVMAFKQAA